MKKNLKLWLVLGGLALLVGLAYADYNVQDKGTYYNNASTGLRTNSTGSLLTEDANKNRDYVVRYDNIISDTISIGTADSTQVLLDTHDVSKAYLLINVTGFSGAATMSVRMAIRVTGHTNSVQDSSTTFNFDFNPVQSALPADSLVFGGVTLPTSVAFASTECVAVVSYDAVSTAKYPRRASIIIPLKDSHGNWFWSEYTGVMVRVLSATANTPRVTVHYRGTAL